MSRRPIVAEPRQRSYDVVIVGGAMIGSSVAWFLSANRGFTGSVLVVERDPSYRDASTSHTNSCIRQQFSTELNVRISQYGARFIRNFRQELGGDPEIPDIVLQEFGYLYLAGDAAMARVLRESQAVQAACGAATRLLEPGEIAERWPFYNLDGIVLGSHNGVDEGYFDGGTMFDWWRRKARDNGAEYVTNQVVAIGRAGHRIETVTLGTGTVIRAGTVINASGPRAAVTARMAGLDVPVEPRRRYTFVFTTRERLPTDLPLTIDPSGVHVRSDGANYLCGCPPDEDGPVAFDDFDLDPDVWQDKVWPAIAHRVPAFEAVRLINGWVGHYAYNTLDQNAIIGPHPEVDNFIFVNGFSGHGFQQAAAMGRGVCELVAYGGYRELDLGPLGYERIVSGTPFREKAII